MYTAVITAAVMAVDPPTCKVEWVPAAGVPWSSFELGAAVLGTSALGASADWVDISSAVLSCSIRRGKQTELLTYRAGLCNITLRNTNRDFDPVYESSPYWDSATGTTEVKPGRAVRVTAIESTAPNSETVVFFGTVREWAFGFTGGPDGFATSEMQCSDALHDLSLQNVTVSTTNALSGTVATEVLNAASMTKRAVDAGDHTLAAQTLTNVNAKTALDIIAFSEGTDVSAIWCAQDGNVTFSDYSSQEGSAVQANFGGTTPTIPIEKIAVTYNSSLVYNDVSLQRVGGTSQNSTDSTSITDVGKRNYTKSGLYSNNDIDVKSLCDLMLTQFAQPEYRLRTITVNGRVNSAAQAAAITLDIRMLCNVKFQPPPSTSGLIDQDHFIISKSLEWRNGAQGSFMCTLGLNSTTGKIGNSWILGTSQFPITIGF